eukprot:CAMPEP_0168166450 /NCGR_PEP_ID=MMETSP0139_2-20121125/2033_1 /TAXON_ID=44445 /ORGANISM="Pseudo-nitzschia australis, Strain 10249 10 AB" /LENGTH=1139 /DNA_ID=CAMNT_0008083647 /DNA_START=242 /DNA_END=3661 /DNA_ORIENTATION=+
MSSSFLLSPRSPFSPSGNRNDSISTPSNINNINSSSSSSSHHSNKRQLIRPTSHVPWSVDVVSAVPRPVVDILDTVLSGATHNKWACLAFPKGIVYVWQIQQTSNLGEPLQRPKEYVKFYLPDLQVDGNGNDNGNSNSNAAGTARVAPLVALSSPHGGDDRDSVHLYVLHPITGWLVLRKITRRDMRSTLGTHTARVRILISSNDDDGMDVNADKPTNSTGDGNDESSPTRFTALTCHKSMVVAGTSKGDLYWITHIAVPVGLHVQKVEAPDNSSFLSRLIFGTSNGEDSSLSFPSTSETTGTTIIPLAKGTEFLALSIRSGVVKWNAEQPIASGHHAIFSPTYLGTFAESLATSATDNNDWTVQKILKAVMTIDFRFLHCIVRGKVAGSGESRLYWIVARLGGASEEGPMKIVRSHWLSRFALPDQVRVLGLVSCDNESVYAAVSTINEAVIVMALVPGGGDDDDDRIIQEVDLPMAEIPDLLPSMMERDTITHGCYMVASSGIGMRARYMPQQQNHQEGQLRQLQSPSKRRKFGNDKILAQHLRSHFWASYQDPNVDKPTPPSLLQADPTDLESAMIQIGAELQQKGDPSSYSISIEWQHSFITLLQKDGLYRHLSEDGKWKLLGIGQELCTFGDVAELLLHQYKHTQEQDVVESWRGGLQSQAMADWFLSIQQMVEKSGWLHSEVWYNLLGTALERVLGFREEFGETVYDVTSERCSEPLWISHPSMKEMLNRQIKYWKTNFQDVPLRLIETAAKTALLSNSESIVPSPSREPTEESIMSRMEFVKIQKAVLSLLRRVSDGHDELAFELCVQYRYFDGLCELSIAHEKKRDASSYALDPLFDTMKGPDSRSGWTFPQHVLQWHTDKGLYGQVINYGRHSVSDLNQIMEKNTQLRQYRWIPTVRQGYFGQATAMLLESCKENNGLRNNQWALSMAKLTNKLVPAQSQQAQDQGRKIERSLDLVDAQQMLLSDSEKEKDCPILPPNELVELAITKLEDCFNEDDRVRLAFVGLTVCNFMDDDKQVAMEQTSRIWAECLLADGARWTEWGLEGVGRSSTDLAWLRDEALSSTVFGRLLEECRTEDSMKDVTYGRHIEKDVIDRVQGDENRESFTRVLRVVADTAAADSIRVDSLMVSTY